MEKRRNESLHVNENRVGGESSDVGRESSETRRESPGIGRRTLVTAGLLACVGGALWGGREVVGPAVGELIDDARDAGRGIGPRPSPNAVPAADLATHQRLGGARLYYEVDNRPTRLAMDAGFASQLDASFRSHWQATGWGTPARLSSYGTWIAADGEASSWHHAGRAFDVGRVLTDGGRQLVSCRYDLWRTQSGEGRRAAERAYWRLAATLHRDFAHVLTYLFDDEHHNHIHVDNGVSGGERSAFDRRSRVQVHAVQAMCRYVWGRDVEISHQWDSATRDATAAVLEQLGVGGRLSSDESWHAFLSGTARHG